MEKDSPFKPSVAELAGRFKGHVLPMPNSNDERRRRPPCSLKLKSRKDEDDEEDSDKPTIVSPNPFKLKLKSSATIEKLQANLALSPTALLPSPKSPEVKLQPTALSPTSPLSPTLRRSQSSEEEEPVGFESPPEGVPLTNINKTRARLSFKRRPPTRQHRRSGGEEAGGLGNNLSPCEQYCPKENGDEDQVFDSPAQERECEQGSSLPRPAALKELERDGVCSKTKDKLADNAPSQEGQNSGEQKAAQPRSLEALGEKCQHSESSPPEPTERGNNTEEEEEVFQEARQERGNEMV
ncbi:capZ-interacting protein [Polymixia lowei]